MKVIYYRTSRGDLPVRDYIEVLRDAEQTRVYALIDHLSKNVTLKEPHAKKMIGYAGRFELRVGAHRIFYCYQNDEIVLLHAFRKKSDKTPTHELDTAYSRMK